MFRFFFYNLTPSLNLHLMTAASIPVALLGWMLLLLLLTQYSHSNVAHDGHDEKDTAGDVRAAPGDQRSDDNNT